MKIFPCPYCTENIMFGDIENNDPLEICATGQCINGHKMTRDLAEHFIEKQEEELQRRIDNLPWYIKLYAKIYPYLPYVIKIKREIKCFT